MKARVLGVVVTACLGIGAEARSQEAASFDGSGAYTQDFDSLVMPYKSGATVTTKTWTDGETLPGWYAYVNNTATPSSSGPPATYNNYNSAGNISSLAPGAASTDFALAMSPGSNAYTQIGLRLENTSGAAIDSITLTFTAEEWLEGAGTGASGIQMTFDYSTGTPANLGDTTAGLWTNVAAATFVAPQTGTSLRLDGTNPANSRTLTVTLTGLSWTAGSNLWLRWTDRGTSGGTYYGFGIDDVSVAPVPEPGAEALLLFGGAALLLLFIRRREPGGTSHRRHLT